MACSPVAPSVPPMVPGRVSLRTFGFPHGPLVPRVARTRVGALADRVFLAQSHVAMVGGERDEAVVEEVANLLTAVRRKASTPVVGRSRLPARELQQIATAKHAPETHGHSTHIARGDFDGLQVAGLPAGAGRDALRASWHARRSSAPSTLCLRVWRPRFEVRRGAQRRALAPGGA